MTKSLGQLVLECNPYKSGDWGIPLLHHDGMAQQREIIFKKNFIYRVKQARERRGYTQQYVADQLGLEQSRYKHYETRSIMPLYLIKHFCDICGVDIEWLMTGHPSSRRKPTVKRPAPPAEVVDNSES